MVFYYVVLPSPWEKQRLFPKWPPAQTIHKMATNPETAHVKPAKSKPTLVKQQTSAIKDATPVSQSIVTVAFEDTNYGLQL